MKPDVFMPVTRLLLIVTVALAAAISREHLRPTDVRLHLRKWMGAAFRLLQVAVPAWFPAAQQEGLSFGRADAIHLPLHPEAQRDGPLRRRFPGRRAPDPLLLDEIVAGFPHVDAKGHAFLHGRGRVLRPVHSMADCPAPVSPTEELPDGH